MERADIGLLFLSVDFLASEFIQKNELPVFLNQVKSVIKEKFAVPVMLCNFPLDDYASALDELARKQIFRYKHTNRKPYAWNRATTETTKDSFADELVSRLVARVDHIHSRSGESNANLRAGDGLDLISGDDCEGEVLDDERKRMVIRQQQYAQLASTHDRKYFSGTYEKNLGLRGSLTDLNRIDGRGPGKPAIPGELKKGLKQGSFGIFLC